MVLSLCQVKRIPYYIWYTQIMELYVKVISFNFLKFLSYPFEIIGYLAKRTSSLGFLILFWSLVAASSDNTIRLESIIPYFLIASSVGTLLLVDSLPFAGFLHDTVQLGDLNNYLIRPMSALPYLYATYVGRLGMSIVFSLVILIAGVGIIRPTVEVILLFPVSLLIAFVISLALNVLIGIVAFHTTEAKSIKNVFLHIIRILSGLFIPLQFFPEEIRSLVLLSPFPSVIYVPTSLLQAKEVTPELVNQLVVGGVWAVVLLAIAYVAWGLALKQYEAVGI